MSDLRVPYKACPLCASTNFVDLRIADASGHPLYRKPLPARMYWKECKACRHVFIDGPFSAQGLSILFSHANDTQMPGYGDAEQKRHVWAETIERVAMQQPGGRWLDIGFGDGGAMATAQEWGFDVEGVDIRASVVEAARELGFIAYAGTTTALRGSWTYDVVSMFDVLEHTSEPPLELRRAHELLADGGLLVVSCPNLDCFAWRALDAQNANPYWAEIEHYHNFSRARLVSLLEAHGFDFVSYAVSSRWRLGMEIIASKSSAPRG